MRSTRVQTRLNAPRAKVFAALVDATAVEKWKVPDGMSSHVHDFDATVGGTFRVSLTYETIDGVGKTSTRTDTYHGRFLEIVPNERVVETAEFETDDPAMKGEMTSTYTLADADGGTELVLVLDGVPPGVSLADNELGSQLALAKLARFVEGRGRP